MGYSFIFYRTLAVVSHYYENVVFSRIDVISSRIDVVSSSIDVVSLLCFLFNVFRRVWRCDESENSLQQKGYCPGPDVGSAGCPDGWVRLWTVTKTSRIFSVLLFIIWLICFFSVNFTAALHLDRARLFGKQLRVTRTYLGHYFPLCSNLFVYFLFFSNLLGCSNIFNWCMFCWCVAASKHNDVQMPKEGQPDSGLTRDFSNSPVGGDRLWPTNFVKILRNETFPVFILLFIFTVASLQKTGLKNFQNIFPPADTLHLSNIP